jgi:hypothetical protein
MCVMGRCAVFQDTASTGQKELPVVDHSKMDYEPVSDARQSHAD